MERVYTKLVRDNIPDIIRGNGEDPVTRVLDDNEYRVELESKLGEEYQEVLSTTTSEDRIEELADMLEIIMALADLEDKSLEDVVEVANQKRLKRGGFAKKIYLEKVITDKE